MPEFRIKTQLLDIALFIGHFLNIAIIVGIFLVHFFAVVKYSYITETTPNTNPYLLITLDNFREASIFPELAPQLPVFQAQALFYRFQFWVIESNILRILYPIVWFFSIIYLKQSGIFIFSIAIFSIVFFPVELIKFIYLIFVRNTPATSWMVTSPSSTITPSTEFEWILWSTLVFMIYIIISILIFIVITIQSRSANNEESQMGINSEITPKKRRRKKIVFFTN